MRTDSIVGGESRASLILELLREVGSERPNDGALRVVLALASADPDEIKWAFDAGLGPLMYHLSLPAASALPTSLAQKLLSADLVARVHYESRVATAEDVLKACADINVQVTLLKGVSISEQLYPIGHHRPMSDIDVLVTPGSYEAVVRELIDRGYQLDPLPEATGLHHGPPLFHPVYQVWLEVHTMLFRSESRLSKGRLFSLENTVTESRPFEFHGHDVSRLTNELQIIYIASYWCRDLCLHSIHPSFVFPVFDAVQVLNKHRMDLDWDRLLYFADNRFATASLYVLLTYLERRKLAPIESAALSCLQRCQSITRAPELAILHALMDGFLIGGRTFPWFNSWHLWTGMLADRPTLAKFAVLPWNLLFPPAFQNRYDWRFQLGRQQRFWRRLSKAITGLNS